MTKQNLIECRQAALARRAVLGRIRELREDARYLSGVGFGGEPRVRGDAIPKPQRYVERLEKLSEEYEKTASIWAQKAAEIERAIRRLPPDLGELIRLRYVDGLRWAEVNDRLYVSESTSKRMHRRAMELIAEDGLV